MTFIVDDNLKVNAIIAASSNSIGTDGQVLASNGSVIYWADTAGDVPGANGQILFHYNEQLQANTTLYWHYANNTLEVSGNVVVSNVATFNSNKYLLLPRGTTGERDSSPVKGQFRYNTTDDVVEWYNGSGWQQAGTSSGEENQNAYSDLIGDSGTASAEAKSDTITFTGANGIFTTVSDTGGNDTVTIDADGANGILVTTDGINIRTGNTQLVANSTGLWINSITESQISDLQSYLTSYTETNDLTAAVTWANVPDDNITQSSVTQHEGALSIGTGQLVGDVALGSGTSGDYVASISTGNGLSGSGSGQGSTPLLTADGANGILVTTDGVNVQTGNTQLVANTTGLWLNAGAVNISEFVNDSNFSSTVGTVTSVGITAGNLIDVSGGPITGSGNITVDVDLSELTTSTSDADGDFFAVVDASNVQRKLTKANINLSGFNNDANFSSTVGTVTEVTGGNGLTGSITTSGSLSVGAGDGITVNADDIAVNGANGILVTTDGINVLTGNTQLVANTTGLWLNAGAVNISEFVNDSNFSSTVGTVTSVTGGNGLTVTNGTTTPDLNVGQANGVIVDADSIQVKGANGILVTTDGVNVQTGNTQLVSNTSGLWLDQSQITVTESQISDLQSYLTSYTETDPVVAAINGIVKSNGTTISAAVAGTDYLTEVSQDTSPQIGGNLDLNSKNITGTGNIDITGSLTLANTDPGSVSGPSINLYRNSASPAGADYIGEIDFQGESSTGVTRSYAQIKGKIADPTNSTEDGTLEFWIRNNGSNGVTARMNENGLLLAEDMTLKFEGATNNTNETTLTVADPTADRTITLPDNTGTVALTSDLTGFDIGIEVDWAAATDVADISGTFTSGDKLLIQEAGVGLRKIDYDDLPGASGALTATNGVANRVAVFSASDNVNGDANFIWLDQRLTITGNTSVSYLELTNGIVANGSLGTTDQVLTANSTGGTFWKVAPGSDQINIDGGRADSDFSVDPAIIIDGGTAV